MSRTTALPVAIGIGTLVVGSVFVELLAGSSTEAEARQFVEAMGFAFSSPGGLIVLAYLADEFEFARYFEERSAAAMTGDFLLAILASAAVGLATTAVITSLTDSGLLLFVVPGFFVFGAAFLTFAARTKQYFDLDAE